MSIEDRIDRIRNRMNEQGDVGMKVFPEITNAVSQEVLDNEARVSTLRKIIDSVVGGLMFSESRLEDDIAVERVNNMIGILRKIKGQI